MTAPSTADIISCSISAEYISSTLRVAVPFASISLHLLCNARNIARRNTHINIHGETSVPIIKEPDTVRRTKPIAIHIISKIGICFRRKEYAIFIIK